MKSLTFLVFLAALTLTFSCKQGSNADKAVTNAAEKVAATTGASLNVNTANSVINWSGSKVSGAHTGTLSLSNGSVSVKDGEVTGGSFTIDMNSMTNTDLPDDKKGDLVGHLLNADFFDAAVYPTSKFEITKVTKLSGDPAGSHLVYGNLTLKDVTKQIGFKANVNVAGNSVNVSTPAFTIDRTDFNVKYGSNKFFDNLKDRAINDNIELSINLSAS